MTPKEKKEAHCPECGTPREEGWALHDVAQDWGTLGFGERWHCTVCDAWLVITEETADDHLPTEGSEVQQWLENTLLQVQSSRLADAVAVSVLESMIAEYKWLAQQGQALSEARKRFEAFRDVSR